MLTLTCRAWVLPELGAGDDEELEMEKVSASEVSLDMSGLVRAGSFCFQFWEVETVTLSGGADSTLLKLGTGKADST